MVLAVLLSDVLKGLLVKRLFHVHFAHKLYLNGIFITQTEAQWQVWECDLLTALAFCHINSTLNKTLTKKRSIKHASHLTALQARPSPKFPSLFLKILEMQFY